jgi:hypothetical protein
MLLLRVELLVSILLIIHGYAVQAHSRAHSSDSSSDHIAVATGEKKRPEGETQRAYNLEPTFKSGADLRTGIYQFEATVHPPAEKAAFGMRDVELAPSQLQDPDAPSPKYGALLSRLYAFSAEIWVCFPYRDWWGHWPLRVAIGIADLTLLLSAWAFIVIACQASTQTIFCDLQLSCLRTTRGPPCASNSHLKGGALPCSTGLSGN